MARAESIDNSSIAQRYFEIGQYDKALKLYSDLYEGNKNPEYLFHVAWCYYKLKDYDSCEKIIEFYEKREWADSDWDYVFSCLTGNILNAKGYTFSYAGVLLSDKEIGVRPIQPYNTIYGDSCSSFGAFYSHKTRFKDKKWLQNKTMLHFVPYYNMGLDYFSRGEIKKAIYAFETALEINPNDIEAKKMLDSIYSPTINDIVKAPRD